MTEHDIPPAVRTKKKEVFLFSDGSCLKNPGPGGYGVILKYKNHLRELQAGFGGTTNNRMELQGVIEGLRTLKEPCLVTVITDSKYVKNGITSWIHSWKKNGWKTSGKQPVKNQDLWMDLDKLCRIHDIKWQWVKGHAGHPENERCDELAREAACKWVKDHLPEEENTQAAKILRRLTASQKKSAHTGDSSMKEDDDSA